MAALIKGLVTAVLTAGLLIITGICFGVVGGVAFMVASAIAS